MADRKCCATPIVPEPQIGANDVLVRVRACALNHLDLFVRAGMPGIKIPLPRIPGSDISGEVAKVGANVSHVKVGRPRPAVSGNFLRPLRAMPGGERQHVPRVHAVRLHGGWRLCGICKVAQRQRDSHAAGPFLRRSSGDAAGFSHGVAHADHAREAQTFRRCADSRRRERRWQRRDSNRQGDGRSRDRHGGLGREVGEGERTRRARRDSAFEAGHRRRSQAAYEPSRSGRGVRTRRASHVGTQRPQSGGRRPASYLRRDDGLRREDRPPLSFYAATINSGFVHGEQSRTVFGARIGAARPSETRDRHGDAARTSARSARAPGTSRTIRENRPAVP